jgi:hypothetical protein
VSKLTRVPRIRSAVSMLHEAYRQLSGCTMALSAANHYLRSSYGRLRWHCLLTESQNRQARVKISQNTTKCDSSHGQQRCLHSCTSTTSQHTFGKPGSMAQLAHMQEVDKRRPQILPGAKQAAPDQALMNCGSGVHTSYNGGAMLTRRRLASGRV